MFKFKSQNIHTLTGQMPFFSTIIKVFHTVIQFNKIVEFECNYLISYCSG